MSPVQAPDVHTLTGAYVLDALSPDEKTGFELHLDSCHDCATDVAELAEAVARLGAAAEHKVPPRLKMAVLTRVAETRQLPPLVEGSAHPAPRPAESDKVSELRPRKRFGRRSLLAAAAAILAVTAGLGVAVDQHRDVVAARQDNAELVRVLGQSDARTVHQQVSGGGQATVVASRRADAVVVVLRGLPELPSGRTYQLWLIKGESARSAGLAAADQTKLVRGLGDAATVGLTIEPAGGSRSPTMRPIATVSMA